MTVLAYIGPGSGYAGKLVLGALAIVALLLGAAWLISRLARD